jgi:hypothetical protein
MEILGHGMLAFNAMYKMNLFMIGSAISHIVFLQIRIKYKIGQHFDSICTLQGISPPAESHNVMNQ